MGPIVRLKRFKVKDGKSAKVDEWMEFLRTHHDEVTATLNDEKIFLESIFREKRADDDYLYWFSVRVPGGIDVRDSKHTVDKRHLEFADECLGSDRQAEEMTCELTLMQESIASRLV
jgi:hypothetical protein